MAAPLLGLAQGFLGLLARLRGAKIVRYALLALAVAEIGEIILDSKDAVASYKKMLAEAEKKARELVKNIEEEIGKNIDSKAEVQLLLGLQGKDKQSQTTKEGTGRGSRTPIIKAAIKQKIPFRPVIGKVCHLAHESPELALRKTMKKQKNLSPKDLASKKKLISRVLGKAFEAVTGWDMDQFLLVKLKQFMASVIFETIDGFLDWQSPLKTEVEYGVFPQIKGRVDIHPLDGSSETRLKRSNGPAIFQPHQLGSTVMAGSKARFYRQVIIADLVITEYRKERCNLTNIFAIVEIKFPGDTIQEKQFKTYNELLKLSSEEKQRKFKNIAHTNQVKGSGKLALFRYPEDMPPVKSDASSKDKNKRKKK